MSSLVTCSRHRFDKRQVNGQWLEQDGCSDVCGLLRISTALTFAGLKGPKLWWTGFHDAFTVFSDASAITFAAVKAEALFDRWGAKFTIASREAVDFSAM